MKAAGAAEEGDEPLVYIDEPDLVTALMVDEELLPLLRRYADARIQHVNLEILRVLDEPHLDFPALRPFENAVNHCIFHQGLQEQRRHLDGVQLILREIVGNLQPVAEPRPLQLRVAFDHMKLLGQGDKPGWIIQAVAEIVGQILDELPCRVRVAPHIVADCI